MKPSPCSWFKAAAVCSAAATLTACGPKPAQAPPAPPPPAVVVATVTQKTVPIYVENVAQTEANATVEIRARVKGFLTEAPFKEGGYVKKGDLLFQIDPKPYQAAVDQAKANVFKAEANVQRSKSEMDRLKPLVEQRAIAQQDLDNAEATAKVAEGDLLAARAGLTTAELELGYTEMKAPFDGLIGAREVDVGNYVGNSSDLLATISTTEPMRAVFHVAETNYLRYQLRFMGNESAAEEHSAGMEFELILSDGSTYGHKGKFAFAERALDARAGTLKIVVTFPNPDLLLRPGQFARVRAKPEERPDAILVPQRAVITTQSAQSVMVVGTGNKLEVRPIKTSNRYEDQWIVTSGLKPGERVVIEGLQKAAPGSVVNPTEAPAVPADEAAPATTAPAPAPATEPVKATAAAPNPAPAPAEEKAEQK